MQQFWGKCRQKKRELAKCLRNSRWIEHDFERLNCVFVIFANATTFAQINCNGHLKMCEFLRKIDLENACKFCVKMRKILR